MSTTSSATADHHANSSVPNTTTDVTESKLSSGDLEKSKAPSEPELHEVSPALSEAFARAHVGIEREEDGFIYIYSLKGDPDSPRSWSNWKRCRTFLYFFSEFAEMILQ